MASVIIISVAGCAGRSARLTQINSIGDVELSCKMLRSEQYGIQNRVSELRAEQSGVTPYNGMIALLGLFTFGLFWLGFDFRTSGAIDTEIAAYNQRHNNLLQIYNEKDCYRNR